MYPQESRLSSSQDVKTPSFPPIINLTIPSGLPPIAAVAYSHLPDAGCQNTFLPSNPPSTNQVRPSGTSSLSLSLSLSLLYSLASEHNMTEDHKFVPLQYILLASRYPITNPSWLTNTQLQHLHTYMVQSFRN